MPNAKRNVCNSPSACGDALKSPKKFIRACEAAGSNATESTGCAGGTGSTSARKISGVKRAGRQSRHQIGSASTSDPDLICRAIAQCSGHATALIKMRHALTQKCDGVTVYVDDMKRMPSEFWIKRSPEDVPIHYEIISSSEGCELVIPQTMTEKWQLPLPSKTDERQLCLSYMKHIFQNLADVLSYDHKTSSWTCIEESATMTATTGKEDNHDKHEDLLGNDNGDQDNSENLLCLIPEQATGDHVPTEKLNENAVHNTLLKYGFLSYDVEARLIDALQSPVRGRDTICMLIRLACAVAFGPQFETRQDSVFVYLAGTPNSPFEHFPIVSKDKMLKTNMSENVIRPELNESVPPLLHLADPKNFGHGSWDSNCGLGSNCGFTSPRSGSNCSSKDSNESFPKGYVDSDIIVACPSDDSAKFMLVINVKSSPGRTLDMGHMLRQTAGALVGQKQVFGLVISRSKAALLKACRDDDECAIIRSIKEYDLLRSIRSAPYFNSERWFDLFVDIVKVVDAAKEYILLE